MRPSAASERQDQEAIQTVHFCVRKACMGKASACCSGCSCTTCLPLAHSVLCCLMTPCLCISDVAGDKRRRRPARVAFSRRLANAQRCLQKPDVDEAVSLLFLVLGLPRSRFGSCLFLLRLCLLSHQLSGCRISGCRGCLLLLV